MAEENGTTDPQYPGLNDAVARAVREALAAGALAAPLEPPPPAAGLQMAITPKLGLRQPALDDPALITDLNENFGILDESVTATVVATLTNKTLTAPVINNPTITGWGNAQHSHLDAAGAGQLDGAAVVSGDIGTGFLVRETYVQEYLNSGSDLVDAVVRDTLWWGLVGGSEVPDTSLQREAPARLRLNGVRPALGVSYNALPPARLGQMAYETPRIDLTTNAWYDGANWHRDDPTKSAVLIGAMETETLGVRRVPAGANPIDMSKALVRLVINAAGTLTLTPDAGTHALVTNGPVLAAGLLESNGPGAGTSILSRDDATNQWLTYGAGGAWHLWSSKKVGGGNDVLVVSNDGTMVLYPSATAPSIIAAGPIYARRFASPVNAAWLGNTPGTDNGVVGATQSLYVDAGGNYVVPWRTGEINLGVATNKWAGIHGVAAFLDTEVHWGNGAGALIRQGGANPRVSSNAGLNLELYGNGAYVHPAAGTDALINLGAPSVRWGTVYAATGTISTSTAEAKNDLGLLDPEEALAEVLRVPVHRFTYKTERKTFEDVEDEEARQKALDFDAQSHAYSEYERVGFMAEEATDPSGGDALLLVGPDGVDGQNTASVGLAAIQALAARQDAGEERLQALLDRVMALEGAS